MLQELSYFPILGRPLIMYLGIFTLMGFLLTAAIGMMIYKGMTTIPFAWHPRVAMIALVLAIVHGLLGVLLYF